MSCWGEHVWGDHVWGQFVWAAGAAAYRPRPPLSLLLVSGANELQLIAGQTSVQLVKGETSSRLAGPGETAALNDGETSITFES